MAAPGRNGRLRPPPVAGLDAVSSISRQLGPEPPGGDDGPDSLRLPAVQQRLFDHIVAKLGALRASAGDTGAPSLAHIVVLLRKLREGIVATNRTDAFAVRAYVLSATTALEAADLPEAFKAFVVLATHLYPALEASGAAPAGHPSFAEREELAGLYLLHIICCGGAVASASTEADAAAAHGPIHADSGEVFGAFRQLPTHVRASKPVVFAMSIFSALRHDIDFAAFARLWSQSSPRERILISTILPRVRLRIVRILARAFYMFPESLLLEYLCMKDDPGHLQPILVAALQQRPPGELAVSNGSVSLRPLPRAKSAHTPPHTSATAQSKISSQPSLSTTT